MLWDTMYLYIGAEIQEHHIWGNLLTRDTVIFHNNDFEVFIDPDGDTHNYYELEINALGTVWDLMLVRPYRDGGPAVNGFDFNGLKTAVYHDGTINDPGDKDKMWSVEMCIPWMAMSEYNQYKKHPWIGETLKINFSRVQWETRVENGEYIRKTDSLTRRLLPENNWVWAPQGSISMHIPEMWGVLQISDNEIEPNNLSAKTGQEERIKWFLRQVYYKEKEYHLENKTYTNDLQFLGLDEYPDIETDHIQISSTGNQFIASYPENNNTILKINHQGRVWKKNRLKNWIWMGYDDKLQNKEWEERFMQVRSTGFDGIHFRGNKQALEKIIPLAKKYDLEVHAWFWVLNCNSPEIIKDHPGWYSVSRNGESTADYPPYVKYYKWLCPSKQAVIDYLKSEVGKLSEIEGLDGIHLDYIRHPDVILPIALQPKYNLVQDHEMPEFDFCYCDSCRFTFHGITGIDPQNLKSPENNSEWKQYRYDIVTKIVAELTEVVHAKNRKISAAVFPTPELARKLVRQDWDKWPLDAVFPMVYHNFYNEDIGWIGDVTYQNVAKVNDRFPHYTGIYIPSLSPGELSNAVKNAANAGSYGIAVFDYNALTDAHWALLKKKLKEYSFN